jgi:hypothetical protein
MKTRKLAGSAQSGQLGEHRKECRRPPVGPFLPWLHYEERTASAALRGPEGDRPVQEPCAGTDRALAWCQHDADDPGPAYAKAAGQPGEGGHASVRWPRRTPGKPARCSGGHFSNQQAIRKRWFAGVAGSRVPFPRSTQRRPVYREPRHFLINQGRSYRELGYEFCPQERQIPRFPRTRPRDNAIENRLPGALLRAIRPVIARGGIIRVWGRQLEAPPFS